MGKLRDKLLRMGAAPDAAMRSLGRPGARRLRERGETDDWQGHVHAPEYADAPAEEGELADLIVDEYGEVHTRAQQGSHELVPSVHAAHGASPDRLGSIRALREQMARMALKLQRAPVPPAVMPASYAAPSEPHVPFQPASGLPGELLETPDGPLRLARIVCEEDHAHGVVPVGSALEAHASEIAVLALDPALAEIDFSRALYIDTETTGLAGGAGTLPFVIGMAWFEGRRLCVEQLLLPQPGLELPMLRRLAERLEAASAVISFNGKSFDWPLLRTRFVMQRVAAPALPAHLDLLHCARRVYKRRLGSVRLVHLEEEILGFTRVDDIAGEMIPLTYLGYLRGQVHGSALGPILEHNRSDLIALAALLGEITRRFRGEAPRQDARDQLGFAGVAARAAQPQRALDFAAGAVEADLRGELSCEAHYLAGELRLKALDFTAAERAFALSVEAAAGVDTRAARAHLALAKLYEHRLKRYADALVHARLAAPAETPDAHARRLARLALKCERACSVSP